MASRIVGTLDGTTGGGRTGTGGETGGSSITLRGNTEDVAEARAHGLEPALLDRLALDRPLAEAIGDYELRPWVDFWRLRLRLEDGSSEGVAEFLEAEKGTYLAEKLRGEGFMLPKTETGKDSDAVIEIIRQDIANGGGTLNEARMTAAMTEAEQKAHRADVLRLADEFCVDLDRVVPELRDRKSVV